MTGLKKNTTTPTVEVKALTCMTFLQKVTIGRAEKF